ISGDEVDRLQNQDNNKNIKLVSDLIEIPLADIVYENFQVWREEPSDDFSVKSAYKLLEETNSGPIRDVGGEFLASNTVLHSDVASPSAAEAHAGLQAMQLGISMGFSILEIVGDSITIIKKCQTTDFDRSVIGALIRDIHNKKIHFQEI
ncbi:hypothetical protein Goarm_022608, partial [Gossypium armourianum]|nr:hypothetical protein [Gossypium armourianum]